MQNVSAKSRFDVIAVLTFFSVVQVVTRPSRRFQPDFDSQEVLLEHFDVRTALRIYTLLGNKRPSHPHGGRARFL